MERATAEERALARAALYRLLALSFSYPGREVFEALAGALDVALVGAPLVGREAEIDVHRARTLYGETEQPALEACYQRIFTLTYSADCPLYETAFSARHLFQQTQQQADIAGFYRAFGVVGRAERPDHLAAECEFAYLLTLKEGRARFLPDEQHVRAARHAQRLFVREHLARWAPLIGRRVALTGAGTFYEAAGLLLRDFTDWEVRFLRLGKVALYRDEPELVEIDPESFTCPAAELVISDILQRMEEPDAIPTP